MPANLKDLWFSQASLSAWRDCPLKFKYRYIDGLYWPLTVGGTVSEHIERGRVFHLLAQRYFAGDRPFAGAEPLLAAWLASLQQYLPLTANLEFLPEYELRQGRGQRLLAKYDLLVIGPEQITIYDWKTDERPPGPTLAASIQTRLYLSLLAGSQYFGRGAESIAMVYWNPRFPQEPLRVNYSAVQQQKDEDWIEGLIAQVLATDAFPATFDEKKCRFCEYRPICRGQEPEEIADPLTLIDVDWEQVQEIVLTGVNFT